MFKTFKRKCSSLQSRISHFVCQQKLSVRTFYWKCLYDTKRKSTPHNPALENKLVTILIPVPGENVLNTFLRKYYFEGTKNLLTKYLPRQTHKNFEALVYCDGTNARVKELVQKINDKRIRYYELAKPCGLWGHPQTRKGMDLGKGDFFVRMNCDNHPYPHYLSTLLGAIDDTKGFAYARVIFSDIARKRYRDIFVKTDAYGIPNELRAFILPRDLRGSLTFSNVSCMNYMVRMDIARKFVHAWSDEYVADWLFIEELLRQKIAYAFVDALVGEKR